MVFHALPAHASLQNKLFTEARKPSRRFVEVLNGCKILYVKLRDYANNGKEFLLGTHVFCEGYGERRAKRQLILKYWNFVTRSDVNKSTSLRNVCLDVHVSS